MPVGQAVIGDERLRLGRGGRLGRCGGRRLLGAGLTTPSTRATTSSALDASRSDCDELLAHQRAGQAGQQLHVLGAAGVRGRDQEGQIGGAVGSAEVDRRATAARTRWWRCRRRASGSAESRCRRAVRWPTALRGPSRRRPGRRRRWCARRRRGCRRGGAITASLSPPASTSSRTRSASMIGREAVLVMAILSVGCYGLAECAAESARSAYTRTASRSISAGVGSAEPGSAAAALP